MNGIDFANKFSNILDMGARSSCLIVLTLLAPLFGVKFSKPLKVVSNISPLLVSVLSSVCWMELSQRLLQNSLRIRSIQLNITDVGWAPLATITWGLPGHFTSCWLCWSSNVIMLAIKKTDTLDVDIFDIWRIYHWSFDQMVCRTTTVSAKVYHSSWQLLQLYL